MSSAPSTANCQRWRRCIKEKDQHIRERSEALHAKKLEKERLERLAQDLADELEALHANRSPPSSRSRTWTGGSRRSARGTRDSSGSLKSLQEQFYSKKEPGVAAVQDGRPSWSRRCQPHPGVQSAQGRGGGGRERRPGLQPGGACHTGGQGQAAR